jgi:hypothetical protein
MSYVKKLSIMPRSGDFACAIKVAICLRQSNDFRPENKSPAESFAALLLRESELRLTIPSLKPECDALFPV